jgi:BlaI family transcriptional regulator, penicillinase repressor
MGSKPTVSKGELEVARVLWELGEATPRQVFEAYPNQRKVDFATVQTYLRRLEAKGYVRARREGKIKYLTARIQPKRVIQETINDLLHRLFDGDALPLMRHLISDRRRNRQEIAELRELLDQWEGEHESPK